MKTVYYPHLIPEDESNYVFKYLRDNIEWDDGIPSKKGYTRKAKAIDLFESPIVQDLVLRTLWKLGLTGYVIEGTYLNYYQHGDHWTPNHSHPNQHQMIISLGATRQLYVGKKAFPMGNGDVIVFGSGIHGVPKDPSVTGGRISIATFMTPV